MKHFNIFCLLCILTCFVTTVVHAGQRVRHVEVNGDEIVTVRTSLGIATIIQVPDRPNSVVVGDLNSFKVEYLDQAITIKPLATGVKSNLYVYTDWRRYNVGLVSGNEAEADYVVYLETPKKKPSPLSKGPAIAWTDFKNRLVNGVLTIEVTRLGRSNEGLLLIEFWIKGTERQAFKPEWIWLTQGGSTRPIHNLLLSDLEVTPSKKLSGVLFVRPEDLVLGEPFKVELRRNKNSFMTILKVSAWK